MTLISEVDVASRYAQALFESAKESHEVDSALSQLELIASLVKGSPDLERLLRNPDVTALEKEEILSRVLGESLSGLVLAFLHVVIEFGRSEALAGILESFTRLLDADRGLLRVTVRSSHTLSDEQISRISQHLSYQRKKKIIITQQIDSSLLGGLQIHIENRIFDSSLRRQLNDLKEQLLTTKVH